MNLLEKIVERAKSNKQRIVLPEATEERTLRAADKVLADGLAELILIGNPDEIASLASQWELGNIDKATIIDPENNPKSEEYASLLAELRKKKGMTIEQACDLVKKFNPKKIMVNFIIEITDEGLLREPVPHARREEVL